MPLNWFFVIPWTVAHKASLSMEFSRQEYWSELPFPYPEDLPDPRIKPGSPAGLLHHRQIQYHLSHQGSPKTGVNFLFITTHTHTKIYKYLFDTQLRTKKINLCAVSEMNKSIFYKDDWKVCFPGFLNGTGKCFRKVLWRKVLATEYKLVMSLKKFIWY